MPYQDYPVLEIQESNLKHNLKLLQSVSPVKTLLAVKANAYGLGIREILPAIQKMPVDMLGVANPHEGVELRQLQWKKPILNLGGFFPQHADFFFQYGITPSITDLNHIDILGSKKKSITVHLKFDFGMGRIGLLPEMLPEVQKRLAQYPHIEVGGIYTHFPQADKPNLKATKMLMKNFLLFYPEALNLLNLQRERVILHSANSYASMLIREARLDMIRPGLMFYGYFQNLSHLRKWKTKIPLEPALRLKAYPISVRKLAKGHTISYGSTYRVPHNNFFSWVLPLGYADGIPVALSNNIRFGKYKLIGRVTMDQIMVAGSSEPDVVELLGENSPPLEKWAELAGTHSYEILTGLGKRLRRVLV